MKLKKIVLICLLIIIIIGSVLFLTNTQNKSTEKISSENNNTMAETTTNDSSQEEQVNSKEGIVRKSEKKAEADMNNILEIKDNFFIEQTNDMYYNMNDYLGKTIKIEGFIYNYKDSNGDTCYCVIRNTPGCCGNDGLAGLDIRYNDEYPEVNTWVEIIGVVEKDIVYDQEIPAIHVTSLKQKEPGVTFVTN